MQEDKTVPDFKLEYSTCVDFCKYSGGVQIAQTSMLFVIMSGFVYFVFGDKAPTEPLLTYLKTGAGALAFCLWVVEESHAYLASTFFCRARELDKKLGFNSFSQLPKLIPFWWGPTNWAYRFVYGGFVVFWILVAWKT